MKLISSLPRERRLILWRLGEVFALSALTVMIVWLWWSIEAIQRDLAGRRQAAQTEPEVVSGRAERARQLERYESDLQQLKGLLLPRERVGEFVNQLEREAAGRGVQLTVLDITETGSGGQGGTPAPTGLLAPIQLQVLAVGPPEALLQTLYGIEHLPYLVGVPAWKLTTDDQTTVGAFDLKPVSSTEPAKPPAHLNATVILTLKNYAGES